MLELCNVYVSTCSQKVGMALIEKNFAWFDHQIVFGNNDHFSNWYLIINPNEAISMLIHEGKPVIDSSVVNEYLEDVFPSIPLRPKDLYGLAHLRAWPQFIDEALAEARLPLRHHFYQRRGRGGFLKNEIGAALERHQPSSEWKIWDWRTCGWICGGSAIGTRYCRRVQALQRPIQRGRVSFRRVANLLRKDGEAL